MQEEQDLREAIDACRPAGDDLQLPEMSGLAETLARDPRWQAVFARSQRCDAAIARAFVDVSIPDGLCERLLASVGADLSAVPPSSPTPAAVPVTVATPATSRRSRFSQWAIRGTALGAVAAALLLGLLLYRTPGELPELNESFSGEVLGWTEQVQQGPWDEAVGVVADRLDPAIRAAPRRWTKLATRYDRQTLAYDLTPPGRDFAFAFCIPIRGRACTLSTLPPATPFSTTGGVAIGVWQTQDMVYVLAVQGGQNRYQTFLNSGLLIGLGRDMFPPVRPVFPT